ncbi:alpha/beta fold hydrolase [Ningiella sp. W23]|uniref:alpha/beta fold hydrolase n=1 Tax=Ningiella sp. W23 TaxID=3023715 RepID=UPI0037570936
MNTDLFYQVHSVQDDDEQASALPALVLIHGLFGNSDNLSVIRRHFEHERKVISIDLPDHGKSCRSDTFSFEQYADKVANLLTTLKIHQCVLVGHSLGGKVSMLVAKAMPSVVVKLVVMDIAPIAYPSRHQNVFKALSAVDLKTLESRADAKAIISNHIEDIGTQAFILKSLYQELDETTGEKHWHWRFNLSLIIRDYDLLSAWPYKGLCFNGPTLFMKGADSDYILSEHQSTIMEQFPNASAKIVPAGHWLHAQKPQIVNALIKKFVNE